jgi:uncharacterized repeat protein (TIGR01451 family)
MKITKLISRLFAVIGLLMVFAVSGWGITLDTDNFDSNVDGWAGTGESYDAINDRLLINKDQTGTKTYNFGVTYASAVVTVTLTATKISTWESNDVIQITANGTTVHNSNTAGTITFSATLDLLGQLSLVVTPNTNANVEDLAIDSIAINYAPPIIPEINIVGIADGDTTPSVGENTDFGSTTISTPVDKTYTIQNTGTSALTLSAPTFTGDFSVQGGFPASINAGASATFTVRFAPIAAGLRNGTISLANNDSDENPYTFAVKGKVNTPPVANDNNFTVAEGVVFSGNVTTDDSDPDGDAFALTSHTGLSNPAAGSLTGPASDGTFTFTANAGFGGTSVYFDYNISDLDLGEDTARVTLNIVAPEADLAISKTGLASVDASNAMSYTLNVSNLSSSTTAAQNVVVTDALPSGFVYNGVTASGWSCNLGAALTCTRATLGIGVSSSIVINGFAPSTAGDISNSAEISSDTTDSDTSNNTSNVVVTTVNAVSADVSITKTASPAGTVNTASPLTYTISVRNNGTGDAKDVQVTDSLDVDLRFVSVSGTGWSCSQGQLVICNYTGTGGILATGASAGNITLKVTTPAVAQSVPNEASVISSTFDPTPSNNTSTVTVDVVEGQTNAGEVPMFKYLQYNIFGDMKLIGNANVNYAGTDPNQNYNDNVNMQYVDTDGDSATFNSSSSTLNIDPSYTIVWAGLYWAGDLCESNDDDTCEYSNKTGYKTYDQSKNHRGDVLLKTPNRSGYITVNANQVYTTQNKDDNWLSYGSFADITQYVGAHEIGAYRVANMALNYGYSVQAGTYGGWSILFIYKDDTNTLHFKNISVFNGFDYVNDVNNPTQIPIDGFVTPLSGPITGSVAFFGVDGDPVVGGYMEMRQGKSGSYGKVSNAANPQANVLNSTITEFGTNINTGVTKTYGVDADRLDVSSFLVNDQHDTNFKFGAGTTDDKDYYSLNMFAFATDLTTPIIDNFDKTASIVDANGTLRPAGPGVEIYPGSQIVYTLKFENTGEEIAELFEIFDDFDFDGLTAGLELSNFDASSIKLSQANSTTWQSNPDCRYDSSAHRVGCKIPQVAVGDEYTMEFRVRVRYDLRGLEDSNATNTAYANYKNATTDEFVVLRSNQYGNFGGASNTNNAGVFTIPIGWSYGATGMDAINYDYPYLADKNITTKIVNKPFSLKLVKLDSAGNQAAFTSSLGFNLPVLLTSWNDDTIRLIPDGTELPEFVGGQSEITASGLNIARAHQSDWVKMSFIDWNQLDWAGSKVNCAQTSTTAGNLNGVPQCLNSKANVEKVFPADEFPLVQTLCLGNDPAFPVGKNAACDPSAYNTGGSSGSKGNIYPEKYNHAAGCLQCLADSNLSFSSRSTDNFAARPDEFIISSASNSYPDLLRSGEEYNLSLFAQDGIKNDTLYTANYNRANTDIDVNATLYLPNGGARDSSGLLNGDANKTGNDFNITEGVSRTTGTTPVDKTDVVGFVFNNVGDVKIRVMDTFWSAVDNDDTPQDCNLTRTVIADGTTKDIEGSTYVCGESPLLTFIPHHFTLSGVQLNNHRNDSSLTYLSNDLNMSAHLDVSIAAANKNEGVTSNFKANFYENPVLIDVNVTDWNTSLPVRHPLNNTKNIKDIPTAQLLGFGLPDANGTHTIPWNESNATQQLMFNYARENNATVNPFVVPGSDVNITVSSRYTGTAPEGSAEINGIALADANATFAFGRAKPSSDFYEDITNNFVNTPISIVIHCNPTSPDVIARGGCPMLGIDTLNGQTNESDWWLSTGHNEARGDGNITLSQPIVTEGAGAPTVTTDVTVVVSGQDNDINVTSNATTLPMTVDINLSVTNPTDTNTWLIYNLDENNNLSNPDPFYKVRFIGQSGWTGHGDTGHVVDSNVSEKKNKRLGW